MDPNTQPANPFLKLTPPPDGGDPEANLAYLKDLAGAFDEADHPRLKPIKKKLAIAFKELDRARSRGVKDDIIGKKLATDMYAIQLQLYTLISTLVSQLQVKVRAAISGGVPEHEQADANQMVLALDALGKGVRSLIHAVKKKDQELIAQASEKLRAAQELFRSPSAP